MAQQIPHLDPSPTKDAPFGFYSTDDTQLAEPIPDIDAFIEDVKSQQFQEEVDDDLDPYTHCALSYVKETMMKISGAFTTEQAARKQATETSEGMFDTYVVPFQECFVLGGTMTVDEALKSFAEEYNARIDRMKERLKGISTDRNKESVDPEVLKAAQETPKEEQELHLDEDAKAILAKMKRAVKRGDKKASIIEGQNYFVLSYCAAKDSNYVLRICSVQDSLAKAETVAKNMYNACKSKRRFDYLVASAFEWKPGPPIDFALSVSKTHSENQSLGRFYDSTNFLNSDEYKQALESVSDFHKKAQQERAQEAEAKEQSESFSIMDAAGSGSSST